MKYIYILFGSLFLMTACSADLDQSPPNLASADSLTDFEGVLNAAYYYQLASVTPLAVMADFRADNARMQEAPYTEFDTFTSNLTTMEDQFFGPLYTAMYKSILSANNVIENSTDATQVAEAKFLRALSYFKLVKSFGAVTINLSAAPSLTDTSILARSSAEEVYNDVIIPDLNDAIAGLGTAIVDGRASKYAAQALLGKAYAAKGDYASAASNLATVINGAAGAGISLKSNFNEIFGAAYESGNSEIIYSTRITGSIVDEYSFGSDFWNWFVGDDSKSDLPVDPSLVAAFDASDANGGGTDLRRAVTLSADGLKAVKFPKDGGLGTEHDWIEIRLADVILLYAEALNQTGSPASTVLALLDPIRTRAGLTSLVGTASTQAEVSQAISNERRLELAFEGHRWFDLVRTNSVDAAMGQSVNSNYHVFPIPVSEILATGGVITQNAGY
ncbi:RagB/SusD family nutrient uptake outer membrane protein [Candidatus Arcticimaribacter forsetii]|uniref:RagB/SusD family nutrient uptake outer membrane protein n=1 Tax=Candidatus Arcticimaribacter forsetii TaxID=2820661 RepID=UPI0020774C42|nr:RagB/SusD family nutrient uptake outer membrane protein [Candidatus Arcticimaribacter forsetii]MDA8639730.1 RagB/SusD family nutrient uptake outer membrane protein [Flavobacteriaceae bacterium]MDB2326079.1 RagB/SusD family nutrient uptake outer membrane protein [Flavobacteriaceae bacterium]MDB4714758.1 RagB/SusD family nutrient uptake outer membrane protein [Flavobacteriaceae bacterium]MDB4738322.1 RagB/SusD family nutrient uptake outer membrane protein [Flavobacteriaceae bacterium]